MSKKETDPQRFYLKDVPVEAFFVDVLGRKQKITGKIVGGLKDIPFVFDTHKFDSDNCKIVDFGDWGHVGKMLSPRSEDKVIYAEPFHVETGEILAFIEKSEGFAEASATPVSLEFDASIPGEKIAEFLNVLAEAVEGQSGELRIRPVQS
jgi:hypothetical protein